MSTTMRKSTMWPAVTALTAVLLALLLGSSPAQAAASDYIAVVDAGSSGTRIALFQAGASGALTVTTLYELKGKAPGLSSFAAAPADAGPQGITPLLQALDSQLASRGISAADVPVAIMATAGMRNVQRDNPSQAQAILDSAREAVVQAGHPVDTVRIITGQDEARYAWVAANADEVGNGQRTKGIVEVGGASMQTAFATPRASTPGAVKVTMGKHVFHVVALSYLGLGVNDARSLMQIWNDSGVFCFPRNGSGGEPNVYSSSLSLPVTSDQAYFRPVQCRRAYADVITRVGRSVANLSANDEVGPPDVRKLPGFANTTFQGLAVVVAALDNFDVTTAVDEHAALTTSVISTCSGQDAWPVVVARFDGSTGEFAQTGCSTGTYVDTVVFDKAGLRIDPRHFFVDPSAKPSWSWGYALTRLAR